MYVNEVFSLSITCWEGSGSWFFFFFFISDFWFVIIKQNVVLFFFFEAGFNKQVPPLSPNRLNQNPPICTCKSAIQFFDHAIIVLHYFEWMGLEFHFFLFSSINLKVKKNQSTKEKQGCLWSPPSLEYKKPCFKGKKNHPTITTD